MEFDWILRAPDVFDIAIIKDEKLMLVSALSAGMIQDLSSPTEIAWLPIDQKEYVGGSRVLRKYSNNPVLLQTTQPNSLFQLENEQTKRINFPWQDDFSIAELTNTTDGKLIALGHSILRVMDSEFRLVEERQLDRFVETSNEYACSQSSLFIGSLELDGLVKFFESSLSGLGEPKHVGNINGCEKYSLVYCQALNSLVCIHENEDSELFISIIKEGKQRVIPFDYRDSSFATSPKCFIADKWLYFFVRDGCLIGLDLECENFEFVFDFECLPKQIDFCPKSRLLAVLRHDRLIGVGCLEGPHLKCWNSISNRPAFNGLENVDLVYHHVEQSNAPIFVSQETLNSVMNRYSQIESEMARHKSKSADLTRDKRLRSTSITQEQILGNSLDLEKKRYRNLKLREKKDDSFNMTNGSEIKIRDMHSNTVHKVTFVDEYSHASELDSCLEIASPAGVTFANAREGDVITLISGSSYSKFEVLSVT